MRAAQSEASRFNCEDREAEMRSSRHAMLFYTTYAGQRKEKGGLAYGTQMMRYSSFGNSSDDFAMLGHWEVHRKRKTIQCFNTQVSPL